MTTHFVTTTLDKKRNKSINLSESWLVWSHINTAKEHVSWLHRGRVLRVCVRIRVNTCTILPHFTVQHFLLCRCCTVHHVYCVGQFMDGIWLVNCTGQFIDGIWSVNYTLHRSIYGRNIVG